MEDLSEIESTIAFLLLFKIPATPSLYFYKKSQTGGNDGQDSHSEEEEEDSEEQIDPAALALSAALT